MVRGSLSAVTVRKRPSSAQSAVFGRLFGRDKRPPGQTIYDWRHYLSVAQRKSGALRNGDPFFEPPESFRQLRTRLIKRPGSDREMVDILALVRLHDEQQIEKAMANALEAGEPSKQHILNCLSGLEEPHQPLPLKPPLALLFGH